MPRRSLSWSAALRDLKDDRLVRSEIREERLRTVAHLSGGPAVAMSAWRGRSGRRYAVTVFGLGAAPDDLVGAVVLAVIRDAACLGAVCRATYDLTEDGARSWVASMARAGVTEIHVYRLAETPADQAAVVVDLTDRSRVAA